MASFWRTCEKGNVLILSAEDGADDTIVPRLKALNAELERIHIVHAVPLGEGKERTFDITRDLERLKREIECIGNVRADRVDPLSRVPRKNQFAQRGSAGPPLRPLWSLLMQ